MGDLFTMTFADFKGDEWKITTGGAGIEWILYFVNYYSKDQLRRY